MNKEQGRAERGDGDDVMTACKLRVGCNGRLFFAVKRLKIS